MPIGVNMHANENEGAAWMHRGLVVPWFLELELELIQTQMAQKPYASLSS